MSIAASTRYRQLLLVVASAFLVLAHAVWQPLLAQTATVTATTGQSCAGTRFGDDLNCTANDFTTSLTFTQASAGAISSCIAGATIQVDIIGSITSGNASRYDTGYFFGESGNNPELNNALSSCSIGMFPTTPTPFYTADSDSCGEINSSSTVTLQVNDVNLLCQPQPGTSTLGLPYLLSFSNNVNGNSCTVGNIVPNTKSKCKSSAGDSGIVNGVGVVSGITVNGHVTITEQTIPDGEPGTSSFTTSASGGATVTPSSANLSDNESQMFQVPLDSAGGNRTLTITEAALSGWDSTASITCTTPSGGSASSYVTVDNAARTIAATLNVTNYGALCTVTNSKTPVVKVQKITTGGVGGPFTFTDTGITGDFSDITTTSAGVATPASPTALEAIAGTLLTITEGLSVGWVTGGVTCSDDNAAITGNTNPVAVSAIGSVTVPAAANREGAVIACVFTNAAVVAGPSLSMTKTPSVVSVNAAGQTVVYSIQVNNTGGTVLGPIAVSDTLGTVICPSSGGSSIILLASSASETCSFSYVVPQAVLDNNGGGDGDIDNTASSSATFGGSPVTSSASATVALVVAPGLTINKEANSAGPVSAGDTITYTFRVRNTGNVTITGVGVNDTFNGYGLPPMPGGETMFADAAPLGDSADAMADGFWDALAPGDEIEFTASYTVVQGDIDNP